MLHLKNENDRNDANESTNEIVVNLLMKSKKEQVTRI